MESSSGDEGSEEDVPSYKLAVVARKDLSLTAGKLAVQVGHAVHEALDECKPERKKGWEADGSMIVVLEAADLAELRRLGEAASGQRLAAGCVEDEGLTELSSGTQTVLWVGPDLSASVNKVTGKLRLYKSPAEAELELLRARGGAAAAASAVEMQLDLAGRATPIASTAPDLFEQWTWEGDATVLPLKWEQAFGQCCGGLSWLPELARRPWEAEGFDPEGAFFVTHRSETCGIALAAAGKGADGAEVGLVAAWGVRPEFQGRGLGRHLLRLCLSRHLERGRSKVVCRVDPRQSPEAHKLLMAEGFLPA